MRRSRLHGRTWARRPLAIAGALAAVAVAVTVALAVVDDGQDADPTPGGASRSPGATPGPAAGKAPESGPEDEVARERGPRTLEAAPGEEVRLEGFVITLDDARVAPDPGGNDQVVAGVTLRNETGEPLDYGFAAFTLERDGAVFLPRPAHRPDALGMGSLRPGEAVSGVVTFSIGHGDYVLRYGPADPRHSMEGQWRISV